MIVAIVQARMRSTRFHGKVQENIAGRPMLWHVVNRVRHARLINLTAIATSNISADDPIANFCEREDIACYRGSEGDVLDRYYKAAKHFGAGVIVRVTADCPLIDPGVIDKVVRVFQSRDYDYVSNTLEPTYPDGLDTEVFHLEALEQAWREASLESEREHVTPYIWKHPELFRLKNVKNDQNLSSLRWTVDRPQDLEFIRSVYEHLSPEASFGMMEVLLLLRDHPELNDINPGIDRNEGYQKSLKEDILVE